MGASRLGIYNAALRYLEERKLASLTENREPRRYMDDEFSENNLFCISQGNWTWATRLVRLEADQTRTPNFGPAFAFPKPIDWNHTFQIADNESFNPLLRDWTDMHGYWFADITPIYVAYISDDPNYGPNMGMWTPPFIEYVAARLAWLCAPRLKQSDAKVERIEKIMIDAKAKAVNKDSQNLPPGVLSYGTWTQSRAPRGSITPLGNPYSGSTS